MRFAIAAAVLAQVLPVVVSSSDAEPLQHKVALLRRDSTPASKLDLLHKRTLTASTGTISSSGILTNDGGHPRTKARSLFSSPSGTECNPDVGILSCGIGKYCKSDDGVSAGGVCTPISTEDPQTKATGHGPKSLYGSKFCESTHDLPYYCDCNDWDADAHTGSLACVQIDNKCAHFCPSLCLSQELFYLRNPTTYSWGTTTCVYYSKPYEQTFCTTVYDDNTCKLSLDGIECTSCDLEASDCGTFDCTNVGMSSGDFCDSPPVPPIGSSTCGEPRFEVCDICEGRGALDPTAQYYFSPQHTYHDCIQAYWKGASGFYWDDFDCWYMSALMGPCCASATDAPTDPPTTQSPTQGPTHEACDICEGRGVLIPDAQYYFPPTHSHYDCSQAYEKGMSGAYWDEFDCWYMTGLMSPCCTSVTDPPTTTPSPTTIPATREATNEPTATPTSPPSGTAVNDPADETEAPSTSTPTNETLQDSQINGATGTVPNPSSSVSKISTHIALAVCVVFGAILTTHSW